MTTHKKYYRKLETVVKDGLWPWRDRVGFQGYQDRMRTTVSEVLRRLPQSPYDELKKVSAQIKWLILAGENEAGVLTLLWMPSNIALIVLQERWGKWGESSDAICTVAHELAHLFQDRTPKERVPWVDNNLFQELDAWRLVFWWGFDYEMISVNLDKSTYQDVLDPFVQFFARYEHEILPPIDPDERPPHALEEMTARKIGNWTHLTEEEWKSMVEERLHDRRTED